MTMNPVAEVLDDAGRTRAYLEPMTGGWYHVYGTNRTYWGAGTTLKAAVELAQEKSGMTYEALPEVRKADLTITQGRKIKIGGFQGGGYYQHTTVKLGDKELGRIQFKSQPARRRYEYLSCATDGGCVQGYELAWICKANGLRLVD